MRAMSAGVGRNASPFSAAVTNSIFILNYGETVQNSRLARPIQKIPEKVFRVYNRPPIARWLFLNRPNLTPSIHNQIMSGEDRAAPPYHSWVNTQEFYVKAKSV